MPISSPEHSDTKRYLLEMTDETDVLYREYREWVAKRDVVRSELVGVDLSNEQVLTDAFARLEEVNAAEVVLNDLARRIAGNEDQKQVVFNHWVRRLRKAKLRKDSPTIQPSWNIST